MYVDSNASEANAQTVRTDDSLFLLMARVYRRIEHVKNVPLASAPIHSETTRRPISTT